MPLERFLDRADAVDRSLAVVNRAAPQPVQRMLDGLFADQPVGVVEQSIPDVDDDTVLLLEDGEVLATSSLQEIQESILLVNSDLYITGGVGFDSEALPAVIDGLADVHFRLRGYPESDTEKLLLIVISRQIERLAWLADEGVLRASFQRLSRIEDESGTRRIYQTLADSGVDTHVYGSPNWTPPPGFDVTTHAGHGRDFRDSWFVVYSPPAESEHNPAALVAVETERHQWEGFWTYDPVLATDVNRHVERHL